MVELRQAGRLPARSVGLTRLLSGLGADRSGDLVTQISHKSGSKHRALSAGARRHHSQWSILSRSSHGLSTSSLRIEAQLSRPSSLFGFE